MFCEIYITKLKLNLWGLHIDNLTNKWKDYEHQNNYAKFMLSPEIIVFWCPFTTAEEPTTSLPDPEILFECPDAKFISPSTLFKWPSSIFCSPIIAFYYPLTRLIPEYGVKITDGSTEVEILVGATVV